jgi:hypothetical protein
MTGRSGGRTSNGGFTMTRRSALLARLLLALPVATGLLCAASNASAQSTSVTIPFAFTANSHSLAAGPYSVERVSPSFLYLRNRLTQHAEFLMVRPENGSAIESRGRLVFQRQGKRIYLSQVWQAGSSTHSQLPVPAKRDQEVARGMERGRFELALK